MLHTKWSSSYDLHLAVKRLFTRTKFICTFNDINSEKRM